MQKNKTLINNKTFKYLWKDNLKSSNLNKLIYYLIDQQTIEKILLENKNKLKIEETKYYENYNGKEKNKLNK